MVESKNYYVPNPCLECEEGKKIRRKLERRKKVTPLSIFLAGALPGIEDFFNEGTVYKVCHAAKSIKCGKGVK